MNTKKMISYFISGLLFLIPVFIVVQLIKGISWFVDSVVDLPAYIAFPVACIGIFMIGYFVRRVVRKRIKKQLHKKAEDKTFLGLLARIFSRFDILSDEVHKAFHNPVLYKVDDGIYKLGFITDDSMNILTGDEDPEHHATEASPIKGSIWIYAPYPINFSGELVLVELRKIKRIKKEDTESIPLFVLSAGILKK